MSYVRRFLRELKLGLLRIPLWKRDVQVDSFTNFSSTVFEGKSRIGSHCDLGGSLIGKHAYIGNECYLRNCEIGRYCSIANQVCIVEGVHPLQFVSTSSVFYSARRPPAHRYVNSTCFEEYRYAATDKKRSVIIGSDVWIGFGARIMSGVTIGDGAVIAACALVTKDVKPYEIVAGVPARVLRRRFADEICASLLQSRWWNLPEPKLREVAHLANDPQQFIFQLGVQSNASHH